MVGSFLSKNIAKKAKLKDYTIPVKAEITIWRPENTDSNADIELHAVTLEEIEAEKISM